MDSIEPASDHLLVEKLKGPDQIGMIKVPDAHIEDASFGRVLAVGHLVRRIHRGDVVYFQRYAGYALKQGEAEYVLLPMVDVMGVDRDPG